MLDRCSHVSRSLGFTALSLLVAWPCRVAAQEFDYASAIGVVTPDSAGNLCLAIENAKLAEGTPLLLLDVTIRGPTLAAESAMRRTARCPRDIPSEGESFYEVTLSPPDRERPAHLYFAVAVSPTKVTLSGTEARLDVDGDGVVEEFRTCASREGLHLTVWSDVGMTGKRLWHRYFYLGYGVEPDCSEAEVAGG